MSASIVKRLSLSTLLATSLGTVGIASAGEVWFAEYEQYIDESGFDRLDLCIQMEKSASATPYYSEDYQQIIVADFPRVHFGHEPQTKTAQAAFYPEYEMILPDNIERLSMNPTSCDVG